MKIISVSRRTDVPAFYSEWFMNRIRDGYVRWVNPFSRLVHRISLRPEDVMAFVLWGRTKNKGHPSVDVPVTALVAPKGFEVITTFEIVFGDKHRYSILRHEHISHDGARQADASGGFLTRSWSGL